LKEIRCKKCKALLLKGEVKEIQIKCRKCGHIQLIKEVHYKPGYETRIKEKIKFIDSSDVKFIDTPL